MPSGRSERGAASVEHLGLALLIALALLAAVSAFAAGPPVEEGRELGTAITRKLRCAPRLPGPCWRDPLTEAYGRPLAGLVRALAPAPEPRTGPGGLPLVGVDFRYCRRESCAVFVGDPRLTASNRRTTAFTAVDDDRRAGGGVEVTYWIYRPTLGWEAVRRRASSADVRDAAGTPLLETDDPKLVPLETLAGRNHYDFPRSEEPPWRWKVGSVYPSL
ncbi:MAG: hypothetical protein ACRDL3_16080 [Solirubrobacterales bacterium]